VVIERRGNLASLLVQLAQCVGILHGKPPRCSPATEEHQRMLIVRNSPVTEVIDASVIAFAEVCHAQEKGLVRKQFELLAYARAMGGGPITGKGRRLGPQGPGHPGNQARRALPGQQAPPPLGLAPGEYWITLVGAEEEFPVNWDASPHHVTVARIDLGRVV